ncbi:hypothetical protein SAMN05444281_0327 [Wenyingzhuangia marina]|uniref:Uncharacterized protein n=1 Tax=Wenyingzhuangia marina TaxID=1195760 RepID=A0A1M5SIE6_9FLAO|nr:hypothetical protein SAMN05444281_0327 [Wenyingzhuangia marina]
MLERTIEEIVTPEYSGCCFAYLAKDKKKKCCKKYKKKGKDHCKKCPIQA